MPELPEVETTRRGIAPHVAGHRIERLVVRERRLRWPVPEAAEVELPGQTVRTISRRGKYLILGCDTGSILLHLGMSGSLRRVRADQPPGPHDHVDLVLDDGMCLRLTDPRRFGCLLWTRDDPHKHPLLAGLGPEPLEAGFDGACLQRRARGRTAPVKHFLMDARTVAGLGNIYVNEALFRAGIHPARAAGRISRARWDALAAAVRAVLRDAIGEGGTTLRDFVGGDGRPGDFVQRLCVYGRKGLPCPRCGAPIGTVPLGQRATYLCCRCQR
jgi:formamidopyrimidine-DNA glycosylase